MGAIFKAWMIAVLIAVVMNSSYVVLASPAPQAGLRIANALDHGEGALQIEINGKPWLAQGLASGEVSGLRRMEPGMHRLSFSRLGLEGAEVRLGLKNGELVTLVPHVAPAKLGIGWVIRVLKLDGQPMPSERMATVVYVGMEKRELLKIKQVGKSWESIALKRMEYQRFAILQHRGYLPMRIDQQDLTSLPIIEKGHHVVVLYSLHNGRMASLSYRDRAWPKVLDSTRSP